MPQDRVLDFTRPGVAPESWHFVGLQVANRSAFAGLQDEVAVDSVNQVYRRRLVTAPGAVRVHRCTGRFLDVGRPSDYLAASLAVAERPEALVCRGAEIAPRPTFGRPSSGPEPPSVPTPGSRAASSPMV